MGLSRTVQAPASGDGGPGLQRGRGGLLRAFRPRPGGLRRQVKMLVGMLKWFEPKAVAPRLTGERKGA